MLPMVAAIVAAVHGDAEAAHDHAHRRVVAWLSQRAEVDAAVHGTLAFNRALIEALLDDPEAVLRETQVAGGARAAALLDEAQRIATDQSALLVLDRIARSRAAVT